MVALTYARVQSKHIFHSFAAEYRRLTNFWNSHSSHCSLPRHHLELHIIPLRFRAFQCHETIAESKPLRCSYCAMYNSASASCLLCSLREFDIPSASFDCPFSPPVLDSCRMLIRYENVLTAECEGNCCLEFRMDRCSKRISMCQRRGVGNETISHRTHTPM